MDIAKTLSAQLSELMDNHPELDTLQKVQAKSHVGFGTIRRAKKGEGNITIEKLAAIAEAFKRHPAELLIDPNAEKPAALIAYEAATEAGAKLFKAKEPEAKVLEMPPPRIAKLVDLAKGLNDENFGALLERARVLAETQAPANLKKDA